MSLHGSDKNAFLAELTTAEFALLRSHLIPFDLRAGSCLHYVGNIIEDVIFPHSGLVALTVPLQDTAGPGVALVGRDGIVGGFAAAASAPASSDAEVHVDGQGLRLAASVFRQALEQSPAIRRLAARFGSAMLAQAQHTALCSAAHPVEARICRWLLEIQGRTGSNTIPLTQIALAQLLSVRRTTVTLVAGRLESAGALRCHRGHMQILDHQELQNRSCECRHHLRQYVAGLFEAGADLSVIVPSGDRAGRRAV